MKNKRLLFLFFVLAFSLKAYSTHFKHLGMEDGLAHPAVLAIFQDSLGRVWFGTEEGISIYDGNRIHSYKSYSNKEDHQLFKGDVVKKIVSISGGDVFFKTGKALVKYDIRKEVFSIVWEKKIHTIYGSHEIVWVVADNELFKWNDSKQQLSLHCKLPFDITNSFLIDKQNRKWFATPQGLFVTTDDLHFENVISIPNVNSVFESSNGSIWAGSQSDGLICVTGNDVRVYNVQKCSSKGLHSNQIREIAEDRSGHIWFGSFNGLYKYDIPKEQFSSYIREDRAGGFTHSSVYAVFIDREEVLWAGTYFGGVNYAAISQTALTFYNTSDRHNFLSSPVVSDMLEDPKGNVWICTEGGGLNMLQAENKVIKRFTSTAFPYFLPCANLKSVLYDSDNQRLYIGTNSQGLCTYDVKLDKFHYEVLPNVAAKELKTINVMAKDGDRLFLSTNNGLYVYSLQTQKDSLLYKYPMTYAHISIDSNKRLWLCINNNIHLFDLTTLERIHTYCLGEQDIHNRIIYAFHSSKKRTYVCSYGKGMLKFNSDNGLFEPFPKKSSPLLSNYCYKIVETPSGQLIVTGDKGITVLNEEGEALKSFFLGESLPLGAFTRDCGLLVGTDGTVYVGGTNGLASFNEKETFAPVQQKDLYFTELYVHGNQVHPNDADGILSNGLPFTEEIVLTHTQNKIDLLFTTKTHAPKLGQDIYEYKLNGLDKTWYQTVNKSLSYTNLPPGSYVLEVREKKYLSGEAGAYKRLLITVLPPWYATWWALLIWFVWFCLLAGVVIHIMLVRRRLQESILKEQLEKNQIREIDEAKFRFFTNVSHEFRTPLTLIIGQLEVLLQNRNVTPFINNKLTKIIRQTQHLNNLVTELIEFRKYEQEQKTIKVSEYSLNQYINSEYESFRELALQRNIEYLMFPCDEDVKVWFDGEQMRKVIYNLLSNAFKYTPRQGKIHINLSVDHSKEVIYIRIMDSGVGMEAKDLERIFDRFYQADNKMPDPIFTAGSGIGLALTKSIIETHKGIIEVRSQTGYGTIFTITLQLGINHLLNKKHIVFINKVANEMLVYPQPNLCNLQGQSDALEKQVVEEEEKTDVEKVNQAEKPVVLLVEDNQELLNILVDIFSPFYRTQTAMNGQEGYELIRENKPDLVVSDIMMPVMTGTELCVKVKSDIELCHIPIVLLTALSMPGQTLDGLTRGADDYIYKPFNAQILLARCNNIIRSRRLLYQQFAQTANSDLSLVATNQLDKEFLENITDFIDENMFEADFSMNKIASKMCMGRTTFYNKFKALTGVSPNDFVNSYKLKQAAVLLRTHKYLSIAEIADKLGYNTPSYFCRKFKEQFEVSPSQFRQKECSENSE